MASLTGKVAVVTGASKGIGAGIAGALAQAGAAVIANYDSSKEAAEAVVQNIIAEGGRALAVQADISKAEDTKRLIDSAVKEFGRLKRTLLGVALALIYRVIFSLSYISHLGSGEFFELIDRHPLDIPSRLLRRQDLPS